MAGYLINLSDMDSLENCIKTGSYGTYLKRPKFSAWNTNHEGTFADYLSMKSGDRIFFFVDRKIYGCGKLINIGGDCKYLNYKNADYAHGDIDDNYKEHLLPYESMNIRCFCFFVPDPLFFRDGVDMDEVLQNRECPFHSVRTFWRLSFTKLDDDESDTLFGIVIKHNEALLNSRSDIDIYKYDEEFHQKIASLRRLEAYRFSFGSLISACKSGKSSNLKHEMAIEATLCKKLLEDNDTPFGKWDYISHQVPASPFKPINYMDKMDIFGYRYIPGYKVRSKYIIIEIKKDEAPLEVTEQIMKYVDWVSAEYANGDYSMIKAYIVAYDFAEDLKQNVRDYCVRKYNKGFRPTTFCTWSDVSLVKYRAKDSDIKFDLVN